MPEHETWCCRSPQSPCAQDGGCSGSCNCDVDELIEDDVADPSVGELRASSANPMAASFAASLFPQAAHIEVLCEMIDDRLRRGLPLESAFQLAYERIVSGDA